jgi:AcrR family transcriptional regulator
MNRTFDSLPARERLLDAAEKLLAEKGLATSIRAITAAAGVNLAAVNYYFGSKEKLFLATYTRRIHSINRRRLELLDKLEMERTPVPVEKVLHAFLHPMAETMAAAPHVARLAGRMFVEASSEMKQEILSHFRPVMLRFHGALSRSLPEVPAEDLMWRMAFLVGSLLFVSTSRQDIENVLKGVLGPEPVEQIAGRLLRFAAAGMKARGAKERCTPREVRHA